MRFARLHLLAAVVGAALVCTASAMAMPGGAGTAATKARAADIPFAPADPTAEWSVPAAADWPVVGGSYMQDRYSTLNQVSTGNVASLKEAWHIHLNSGKGTQFHGEGTPLVYQGIMYMVTGNDDVYAIDAATGSIIWTHLSSMPPNLTNICCGWDARGLAIGDHRVFVAQLDGKLLALDQQTGGVMWSATNGRFQEGYTMTMAPLYYKGLVIVGISGSEQGARGAVTAYDAVTGRRVWRFYNVPTPGDVGSGTWTNNSEWQTGGATVWNTPTVDAANNVMTYSTANPDPWSGRGPGDNLFSASIVALDPISGDYKWHFQVAHHDLWDYDCPSPTVMFNTTIGGKSVPAIGESCKTGWIYELDRTTGNPITQIDEKAVPQNGFNNAATTQPIPAGDPTMDQCAHQSDFPAAAPDGKPFIIGCIWTPYDDQQFVAVQPGAGGGTVVATSSYNPNTGLFYALAANGRTAFKAIPNASSLYRNGRGFTGFQGAGALPTALTTGQLVAYDATTNKQRWKQTYTPTGGQTSWLASSQTGTMTTAGNLVFVGTPGGVSWGISAFNATTGAQVWQAATDAASEAGPMTYSVNGKQYIAMYAGGRNVTAAPFVHGDSVYVWTLP